MWTYGRLYEPGTRRIGESEKKISGSPVPGCSNSKKRPHVRTSTRSYLLSLLLLLLGGYPCLAQQADLDLFPRVTLGLSGGVFRPALDEMNDDHRKNILFSAHLAVEVFKLTDAQRLYGVVQLNQFGATKFGPQLRAAGSGSVGLLKWEMRTMNYGARYGVRLFGWKAISWAGGGLSTIALDRIELRSRNQGFESIPYEIRAPFRSTGYYVEVGQLVQTFLFNARPRIGLFWNVKYDYGRSEARSIGGFSLRGGALVGL